MVYVKKTLLVFITLASTLFAGTEREPVIHYDLFETVGWWQPSDAANAWEITGEVPGATRGKALKIIPTFGEGTHRRIMLLSYLPFIRAHKIRLRLWSEIPVEAGKIYLRFEITDANNKVHMIKMYGNTVANRDPTLQMMKPVWGKEVEGVPLPSGQWIAYEAVLPQDMDYVYGEGFVDVGYFAPGDKYKITPDRMIPIKQITISLDAPLGSEKLIGRTDLAIYIDKIEFIGYGKRAQRKAAKD